MYVPGEVRTPPVLRKKNKISHGSYAPKKIAWQSLGLPVCGKNEASFIIVQAGNAILYFHFYGIGISGSTEISTVLCVS